MLCRDPNRSVILRNDRRSDFRQIARHLKQQIPVPGFTCGNVLIDLSGNDLEQTFQARVETVKIHCCRIDIRMGKMEECIGELYEGFGFLLNEVLRIREIIGGPERVGKGVLWDPFT